MNSLKVSNPQDLPLRASSVNTELKSVQHELDNLKSEIANEKLDGLFRNAKLVDGVRILTMYINGTSTDTLRKMCEKARDKAPKGVAAIIGEADDKLTLCVSLGKEAQARGLSAGALVKEIAAIAGGSGGGKADLAMAGIKDKSNIDDALNSVERIVEAALKK